MGRDEVFACLDAEEAKHLQSIKNLEVAIEGLQAQLDDQRRKLTDIEGARRALAVVFGRSAPVEPTVSVPREPAVPAPTRADDAIAAAESAPEHETGTTAAEPVTDPGTVAEPAPAAQPGEAVATGERVKSTPKAKGVRKPRAKKEAAAEKKATATTPARKPASRTTSPAKSPSKSSATSTTNKPSPAGKPSATSKPSAAVTSSTAAKQAVPAQRTDTQRSKVTAVLQASGEPMTARQVAEAIGLLNPDKVQLQGVRNTLETLRKGDLASRPDRGLYAWSGK
ncbi:hypothetical protein ACFVIM_19375 [Streptomyces sp. NPDC057638]|uniref:hypothetical protein n=1 Tax=Streptomyces sp. NPDC057638 TaxID=3346190 RepID=UPI00368AE505